MRPEHRQHNSDFRMAGSAPNAAANVSSKSVAPTARSATGARTKRIPSRHRSTLPSCAADHEHNDPPRPAQHLALPRRTSSPPADTRRGGRSSAKSWSSRQQALPARPAVPGRSAGPTPLACPRSEGPGTVRCGRARWRGAGTQLVSCRLNRASKRDRRRAKPCGRRRSMAIRHRAIGS